MRKLYLTLLCKMFSIGSVFEMPISSTSYKFTSVILEQNLDLFCFIREIACSHLSVLPNALAEFRANLGNSENRDTGKEAQQVIQTSWLKLLRIIESRCN